MAAAFVAVALRPELLNSPAAPAPQTTAPAASADRASYADAVRNSAPSVVSIYTRTQVPSQLQGINNLLFQRFYGQRFYTTRRGLGSGVIVDPSGYIVTSFHVVEKVDGIMVALWDGRVAAARVVGSDPPTDLAVLKIQLDDLPTAPFAADQGLEVGDVVLAIGNALGLSNTVTMGIVSATGRTDLNLSTVEDFIQTDAAINAGNSGGALVNAYGEVVGINSSVLHQNVGAQGIGFAIPVAIARKVMRQIIEYGAVRRGWLGAEFNDLSLGSIITNSAASEKGGVEVTEVILYSPAWKAGLQPGDIILRVDEQPVTSSRDLALKIAESQPGTSITLSGYRSSDAFNLEAQLIQQPPVN
ncbi:MAG: Do family serine endopeptidase AlgW [Wenzhouxiangellaceae bacterium]